MSYERQLSKGIEVAREELRRHGKLLSYTGGGWIITDLKHVDNALQDQIHVVESQVEEIVRYHELDRQ